MEASCYVARRVRMKCCTYTWDIFHVSVWKNRKCKAVGHVFGPSHSIQARKISDWENCGALDFVVGASWFPHDEGPPVAAISSSDWSGHVHNLLKGNPIGALSERRLGDGKYKVSKDPEQFQPRPVTVFSCRLEVKT